jgi:hypothetical protein
VTITALAKALKWSTDASTGPRTRRRLRSIHLLVAT